MTLVTQEIVKLFLSLALSFSAVVLARPYSAGAHSCRTVRASTSFCHYLPSDPPDDYTNGPTRHYPDVAWPAAFSPSTIATAAAAVVVALFEPWEVSGPRIELHSPFHGW